MTESHYSAYGVHHLQVIKQQDDILTAFDLGIAEWLTPCTCNLDQDHGEIKYKLYPLEWFPRLQLWLANVPVVGKPVINISLTKVNSNLLTEDD